MERIDLEAVLGYAQTDDQHAATTAPLEPAVIVAAAGSGKTAVMAARVIWAAAQGVPMEQILGLTFTRKAAGELIHRIRQLVGDARTRSVLDSALDPAVSTYNAFAGQVLAEHGIRLGLEPGAPVLSSAARASLAARVVRAAGDDVIAVGPDSGDLVHLSRFQRRLVDWVEHVLNLDDALSDTGTSVDALQQWDRELMRDLAAAPIRQKTSEGLIDVSRERIAVAELVRRFRAEKLRRQVIDFADQNRLALDLAEHPQVRAALRERFALVLLDEYQDTSLAQRMLMQRLFGDGHPLTAVGDPCQAIYGFRGASVHNIDSFAQHFPTDDARPAALYSLQDNRRSGRRILAAANQIAVPLRTVHPTISELVQGDVSRGEGSVECGLFETVDAEISWIAQRITALRDRHVDLGGVAILVRAGEPGWRLHEVLTAAGIPVQVESNAAVLSDPAVVDVRSMLELLAEPTANVSLARLLAGPRWRIGPRDLAALGARADLLIGGSGRVQSEALLDQLHEAVAGIDPADSISLLEAVCGPLPERDEHGRALPALSPEAVSRLRSFAAEFRALRQIVDEPVPEIIHRVIAVTGLGVEAAIGDPRRVDARQRALAGFVDVAAEFSDVDGSTGLPAFLAMLRSVETFKAPLDTGSPPAVPGAVRIMTVHKAKGLEFDHVFVPFASNDSFPTSRRGPRWTENPDVVPLPLRADAPAALLGYPDRVQGPRDKDNTAFKELWREHDLLEEIRLGYVAFSRARASLVVTGHWSGSKRGPSFVLEAARSLFGDDAPEIVAWAAKPADDAETQADQRSTALPWPQPFDTLESRMRAEAAHAVRAAMAAPALVAADGALTSAERSRVEAWDRNLDLLLAEAARAGAGVRVVRVPDSLSASDYIRLAEDPEGFALDLARPMPRRPAPAARRGTQFHAWVEARYGQQPLLLPEDLPGAADADIDTDERLRHLMEAFERSSFADRAPIALEAPFAIVLAGRVIRGRIDAIYAADHGVEVVDWKTGGRDGLHPLQLAIYRLAWSEQNGIPLADVSAAFYLVGTDEIVRPADLPDRAGLEQILRGPDLG